MKTYLVGGAVRDKLLGLEIEERDWVVLGATPDMLLALGYQQVGQHFPVFLHPKTHEEYALARTEKKSGPGHQGFICDFGPDVSLLDDLQRRDLRINAMALDENEKIIDPYEGQTDIKNRILRHVSAAFSEDPLRVLRVARFHAKLFHLGFRVAPETMQLMKSMVAAGALAELSSERIWKEWYRAFLTPNPRIFLTTLEEAGALQVIAPELKTSTIPSLMAKIPAEFNMIITWHHGLNTTTFQEKSDKFLRLSKTLNIPKKLKTLSLNYFKFAELIQTKELKPELLLSIFEILDAFRNPSVLSDCLKMAGIEQLIAKDQALHLMTILDACRHIKFNPKLQPRLGPAQIQAYFKQERLQCIENLYKPLKPRS